MDKPNATMGNGLFLVVADMATRDGTLTSADKSILYVLYLQSKQVLNLPVRRNNLTNGNFRSTGIY